MSATSSMPSVMVVADTPYDRPSPRPLKEWLLLIAASLSMQLIVWMVLVQIFYVHHLGYSFFANSDTSRYLTVASAVKAGQWPYADFGFEYPPLSLPFMLLPPAGGSVAAYEHWFAFEMIALSCAGAALVAFAAAKLWKGLGRPVAAAGIYALLIAAAGPLVANRFDIAVGLTILCVALFLMRRRQIPAGISVGLGFALKLMPLVLLPLVLIATPGNRQRLAVLFAAITAALIPFVPFLVHDTGSLWRGSLTYQDERPLQIESVLATPYLAAKVLAGADLHSVVPPGGSVTISAAGSSALAAASPWLMLLALGLVYLLLWRVRHRFSDPQAIVLAVFALMLAVVCCNKVLSPQHLLWLLPLVPLLCLSRSSVGRCAGILFGIAVLLTQIEFPAMYSAIIELRAAPLLIVVARNVLLVAALACALAGLIARASTTREHGYGRHHADARLIDDAGMPDPAEAVNATAAVEGRPV